MKSAVVFLLVLGCSYSYGLQLPRILNCNADYEYLKANTISTYDYEVVTRSLAIKDSGTRVGLNFQCKLQVESTVECYRTLKVKECSLFENEPTKDGHSESKKHPDSHSFSSSMQKYPVTFSLSNGTIDVLVAHYMEPVSILNVKRGIISALAIKQSPPTDKKEMRTDVQGVCPVEYSKSGDNVVTMVKDLEHCHFPSRIDWHYSPFSLIWNMSFVQPLMIDSKSECVYSFNNDGLRKSACIETHAIKYPSMNEKGSEDISIKTVVSQMLTLEKVIQQKNGDIPSDPAFGTKKIQYEYERTLPPTSEPENLKSKAAFQIGQLLKSTIDGIKPGIGEHFAKLVKLFRKTPDFKPLSDLVYPCINDGMKPLCTSETQPLLEKITRHYIINALTECNSMPCIRQISELSVNGKIGDRQLDQILLAWSRVKITDPEFFTEIRSICNKVKTRTCYLSLSSALHRFWVREKDNYKTKNLPSSLEDSIKDIMDMIGPQCNNEEKQTLIGLKSLGNLGGIAQKQVKDVSNIIQACVKSNSSPWTVKLAAAQAARRMDPTDDLYTVLMEIVKDDSQELDVRVAAYKAIVSHWQTFKMLNDIKEYVKSDDADYQIKKFIYANLRTIMQERSSMANVKFALLIRKVFSSSDELQENRPLFMLDKESIEIEQSAFHKVTILDNAINQLGIKAIIDNLYDGSVYLPFSSMMNFTLTIFGKDLNLLEVFTSSRNQARTVAALADHFAMSDDEEEINIGDFLGAQFDHQPKINEYTLDPNAPLKFNYNVDGGFLKNLERIRQALPISFSPSKEDTAAMLGYRIFGDELGFTSTAFIKETVPKLLEKIKELVNKPQHRSGISSLVEAFHLVPTASGLPLNWTSNVILARRLDYTIKVVPNPTMKNLELPVEFSASIEEIAAVSISLPGYAEGAIKTHSTASTSFDTGLSFQVQNKNEFSVGIFQPKRQVKILALSRKSTMSSRAVTVDLEDPNVELNTKSKCSNDLVPLIGVKFCHQSSHAKINDFSDAQQTLMKRNANWELSAEFVDKSVEIYVMDVKIEKEDGKSGETIQFSSEGASEKKGVTLKYKADHKAGTYSSQVKVPAIQLTVDVHAEPNDNQGQLTSIDINVMSKNYKIQCENGQKTMVMMERDLPNYSFENKKKVNVDVYTAMATLQTPKTLYSWNRTKTSYLQSDIIDHFIKINKPYQITSDDSILPSSFWENDKEAWVKLRLHTTENPELPPHGYAFFKTPKFIIELESLDLSDSNDEEGYSNAYLNTTIKTLTPVEELQAFLNISYDCSKETLEDGTEKTNRRVRLTLPRVSWTFEANKNWNLKKGNLSLAITRETVRPKDYKNHNIAYWEPQNTGDFNFESKSMVLSLGGASNDGPKKSMEFEGLLSLPGYKPISLDFVTEKEPKNQGHTAGFSFVNPNMDFLWKASEKLTMKHTDNSPPIQGSYHHQSIFKHLSAPENTNLGVYTIDGSMDDQQVKLIELYNSDYHNYNGTLVWKYKAPESSDLTLDIVSDSPIWDLLKMKLKQVVFLKGERMTMKSSLMDVDVEGSWADGYQKSIRVKSNDKNLVPNMIMNMYFKPKGSVVQIIFPDINFELYALPTMTADKREIQVTICKERKCEDIESDPEAFVSQYTYTLDDSTHLAETIIKNPENARKIHKLIENRAEKWVEAIADAVSNEDHPVNKIAKLYLGSSIGEYYSSMIIDGVMTMKHIAQNSGDVLGTLEPFVGPATEMTGRMFYKMASGDAYKKSSEDDLDENLSHFIPWNYYNSNDMKRRYANAASDISPEELSLRPGPIPGKSHVTIYHMPLVLNRFSSLPKWNYAYFDEKRSNPQHEKLTELLKGDEDDDDEDDDDEDEYDHPPYQYTFRYAKYNRFALLWGVGHVLTFDGEHVDLPSPKAGGCSHLLLHNRVNGKVTIARETDNLVFLFPSLKVKLMHNGRVYINDSEVASDLPVHSHDQKVNVTRQNDIVEVSTYYHLNVKCAMEGDYCLFSTTDFTHNSFVGVFGNNNKDPTDEVKTVTLAKGKFGHQLSEFQLSPPASCKSEESEADQCFKNLSTNACYGSKDYFGSSGYNEPKEYDYKVSLCYKLVNYAKFLDTCKQDESCQGNGCASMNAYRALCGANDLAVSASSQCLRCVEGMKIGESKTFEQEKEAEIVLLVDQSQRDDSSKLAKALGDLSRQTYDAFSGDGYAKITFGLIVFKSQGVPDYAEQYAFNGKLFGDVDELIEHGLNKIEFIQSRIDESPCPDVIVDAIDTHKTYYPLRPKSERILLLVTAEDVTKKIDIDNVRNGLDALDDNPMFAISNYPELEENTGNPLADMPIITAPEDEKNLAYYPNGLHARLVFKSGGALLKLAHLLPSPKNPTPKGMNSVGSTASFINEMSRRGKRDVGKCKNCECQYPHSYSPHLSCSISYTC